MDSETEYPFSRNRDISQFLPFFFGFSRPQDSSDPDRETGDSPAAPHDSRDRIVLVNPVTQGMVVIEAGGRSSSSSLDSLLLELLSKDGLPPASKSSIESLQSVEMDGIEENDECAICLEEWGSCGVAKEMPCKHRFHQECIEKWLGIHGSCPVCRFKMPTENGDDFNNKNSGRQRREVWVSFTIGSSNGDRRTGETNHTDSTSAALDDEINT